MNWFSRMRSPAEPASAPLPGNALVIDVRSPGEYASGHVQGAINLPLDRFEQEQKEFFERVRTHYLRRARQYPARFRILNSAHSVEQIRAELTDIIKLL